MPVRETPWESGTPSWVDLMSADLPAAKTFYAGLFGWQIDEGRPEFGGYSNAMQDGQFVCGLAPLMAEDQPTTWGCYLATDDAEQTARAVQQNGGTVIAPPMDVAELGRLAIVQAPDGGVVGLWQAGTHLGCTVVNEPGAVVWAEYLTTDYEGAVRFHAATFGHEASEIGDGTFRYSELKVDGRTVAGIAGVDDLGRPPYWRMYFSVSDTDAAAQRAIELGGQVVEAAHDSPFGRWATLADPQGAQFCVITPPAAA